MIDISLRQLECFVALAETLHFGRAAQKVGMAQPPFSRSIRRLEHTLGTLFDRGNRRVRLTSVGAAMVEPARRALLETARTRDIAKAAAAGDIGSLRIGFSPSAAFTVLPRVLRSYRQAHPDVHLILEEASTSSLAEDTATGTLDVSVTRGPLQDPRLDTRVIHREPFVAVLPQDHRLAGSPRIPLSRLARERFILFPRQVAPGFHDVILNACRAAGFTPTIAEEAAEWHTIVGLVGVGMGVAIAPAYIGGLGWTTVAVRRLTGCAAMADLVVAQPKGSTSSLAKDFVRMAVAGRREE